MTWAAVAAAGIITGGSLLGGAINGPSYPTPSYGGAGGGQPYFYQPTGQGGADTQLQGFFNNYQNPYTSFGPQFNNYLSAVQNNPYQSGMQAGAGYASDRFNNAAQYATIGGQDLSTLGQSGNIALSSFLDQNRYGNPYAGYMTQWANTAGQDLGGIGTRAMSDASGLGAMASSYTQPLSSFATSGASNLNDLAQSTTSGLLPYGQNIASTLPGLAGQYTAPGNAAASQMLSTAFDPQGQLYGQQFQQNLDQTRAGLAARGIDTSGAGQGIEMKSIQDFNTNWQNQQLGRQAQGLSAYDANAASNYGLQSGAYGQGLGSLLSASTGTFNPYATAYTAGVGGLSNAASTGYGIQSGAATTAEQLGAAGANDIMTGAAMPYNASQKASTDQLGILNGIAQAGTNYGNVYAGASNQLTLGANNAYQAGAMPYNAYNTIQGNQYQGLMNVYNPFSSSTQFDNQMQGNLMQYMGLGPNAAEGAFNAGAGAWGANNYNMGQIGNLGGAAAYGYGAANPYPGGPTSFGNSFGASPYMPVSQPNYYFPSSGYGSGTQLAPFTPFTG